MAEQKIIEKERREERLVRILSKDIEGRMKVYAGLTKIKGISWSFSNAICNTLKIDKNRTIGSLTDEEIKRILEFIKDPQVSAYLVNRPRDIETGKDKHLTGADLDLRKEFDIKMLKKIKSYKGLRHTAKLPLRGQRTKAHFRTNRKKGSGIKKKNKEGAKAKNFEHMKKTK
ncbi:MAG: 30S ribosomal protein S13 [Candidatus Diapherotrites archaeon]